MLLRFERLTPVLAAGFTLLLANGPSAQTPQYTVEPLGPGIVINDMNESGLVVGWTTAGPVPGVQAYVAGTDGFDLLPLPAGYASAWAQGINDDGVIVGSAAVGGFPEFGQSIAWTPDENGGYTTQFLGQLPGHTQSVAFDVNNRGDIVGVSLLPGFGGGPTVWFNGPAGVTDLSQLGAPSSPKQINDEGVITGINGGLFDIDTMAASPLPSLTGSMSGFQGWAVNELGELAGKGFHGGTQVSASLWTTTGGWQQVSGLFDLSAPVQAFDVNDAGLAYAEIPQPAARVPGVGTVLLETLLAPEQQGDWGFFASLGGAVNDAGQIAASAVNLVRGTSGVVLMTPVDQPIVDLGGALAGGAGTPQLSAAGTLVAGTPLALTLSDTMPVSTAWRVAGTSRIDAPFKGGTLIPVPDVLVPFVTETDGTTIQSLAWPAGVPTGLQLVLQDWIADEAGPQGFAASNALELTTP